MVVYNTQYFLLLLKKHWELSYIVHISSGKHPLPTIETHNETEVSTFLYLRFSEKVITDWRNMICRRGNISTFWAKHWSALNFKLFYADNNDFRWKRMLFSCIFTRLISTDSDGKKVLHFSNFSESNSNCYCY